jgi:hypothetical protein
MHGMHISDFLLGSVKNNPFKEGVIASLNPITKNDTCMMMMMMRNTNNFF